MMQVRLIVASVLVLATAGPLAQVPPPQIAAPPATATEPPVTPSMPADYTFASGAGLLVFYVQPAKAPDFEQVLGRIREALAKADGPQRKQQAVNWRIYKSAEPVTDAAVYVFAFDPALTTVSYDPLLLIAEVLPAELQPLYERFKGAIVKVERMGLTRIR